MSVDGFEQVLVHRDADAGLRSIIVIHDMTLGPALGGGSSVVIGDPAHDKNDNLLRAFGRRIATLGGRFIPVNDVGTTQADLKVIGSETPPVCDSGDPSSRACAVESSPAARTTSPDFCVNAGGVIFLEEQLLGHDRAQAQIRVRQVGARVSEVIAHARRSGITTTDAATELAHARLSLEY